MFFRLLMSLMLSAQIAGCAAANFSGQPESKEDESAASLPRHGGNLNVVGEEPAPDGTYINIQYKIACADGGPINIVEISGASTVARMTRQSCVDLYPPVVLEMNDVRWSSEASSIVLGGLIYIPSNL